MLLSECSVVTFQSCQCQQGKGSALTGMGERNDRVNKVIKDEGGGRRNMRM